MPRLTFLLISSLLLLGPAAWAQRGLTVGLMGGGNLSRVVGSFTYQDDYRIGAGTTVGLTARYGPTDRLTLRLDARLTRRSVRVLSMFFDPNNIPQGKGYIRRRFAGAELTLPVQVSLGKARRFYLLAGPTVWLLYRQTDEFPFPNTMPELYPTDFSSQTRRFNAGAMIGAGLTKPFGQRWQGFAELTHTVTVIELLQLSFSLYDNLPNSPTLFKSNKPQAARNQSVALQIGVTYALSKTVQL